MIKDILNKLKNIEQALLTMSKSKKIRCNSCHRERYSLEFHNNMLLDSIKKKYCKICVNRKNRERKINHEIS